MSYKVQTLFYSTKYFKSFKSTRRQIRFNVRKGSRRSVSVCILCALVSVLSPLHNPKLYIQGVSVYRQVGVIVISAVLNFVDNFQTCVYS